MTTPIRLLVIEDDPPIRESLVDFFTGRGHEVHAVDSSEAADRLLSAPTGQGDAVRPDAILLDLGLPGRDGVEWLRAFRSGGASTPVLIMTAKGEEDQRIAGLEIGADDYIVKPFSVRELDARIRAVLRRARPDRSRQIAIGPAVVDLSGHEVEIAGVRHRLLQKEAELLEFFLEHPGETHDRLRLLQRVWGYDALPTTRTVDTHVLNLRKKIEARPDRPQHLLTVHRVGYRLVLDHPPPHRDDSLAR